MDTQKGAQMRFTTGILLAALISPLAQADLIDEVNDREELVIAVQPDARPLYFKEGEQATGFFNDLGSAVAKELGVRASFREVSGAEQLDGLDKGSYDMILDQAGKDHDQSVDTSESVAVQGSEPVAIVFKKGNPAFQNSVNNALQRIKDNGQLKDLSQKWFGSHTDTSTSQQP